MLTPEEVLKKVEAEIAENWDQPNYHGIDLRKCLVRPPILVDYEEIVGVGVKTDDQGRVIGVGGWGGRPCKVWLVLEEHPDTKQGYEIVYSEERREFGLSLDKGIIGFYGTFLETLVAM